MCIKYSVLRRSIRNVRYHHLHINILAEHINLIYVDIIKCTKWCTTKEEKKKQMRSFHIVFSIPILKWLEQLAHTRFRYSIYKVIKVVIISNFDLTFSQMFFLKFVYLCVFFFFLVASIRRKIRPSKLI